jgi:hypothetical protein
MATKNGSNYSKIDVANEMINSGEAGGKLKCIFDEITLVAGEGLINDVCLVGTKIPAGAIVHDAVITASTLGTEGILSLGFQATKNADGTTLNADDNAFVDAADAGGAAVTKSMKDSANLAGCLKKFGAPTQAVLKFIEASDVPAAAVIKVAIYFTLD